MLCGVGNERDALCKILSYEKWVVMTTYHFVIKKIAAWSGCFAAIFRVRLMVT